MHPRRRAFRGRCRRIACRPCPERSGVGADGSPGSAAVGHDQAVGQGETNSCSTRSGVGSSKSVDRLQPKPGLAPSCRFNGVSREAGRPVGVDGSRRAWRARACPRAERRPTPPPPTPGSPVPRDGSGASSAPAPRDRPEARAARRPERLLEAIGLIDEERLGDALAALDHAPCSPDRGRVDGAVGRHQAQLGRRVSVMPMAVNLPGSSSYSIGSTRASSAGTESARAAFRPSRAGIDGSSARPPRRNSATQAPESDPRRSGRAARTRGRAGTATGGPMPARSGAARRSGRPRVP